MNAKELKTMTDAELSKKIASLKAELFNLRFSHTTGSLTNPLALNTCKKDIAKVKTIIRERELGLAKAPAKVVVKKENSKTEEKKTVAKTATTTSKSTKAVAPAKKAPAKKAEKIMV